MQGNETQNNVIRVRVSDLLFALQKRWMVIVALSLVGLTFGLILSAMTVVQSSYQTFNVSGSFAVTSKNKDGMYVGGYGVPNVNDFHLAEDMVDAVRYVVRSDHVLNEVINSNELLGYTLTQLRNAITVTQYNTTQILEMKLVWRNAEEGVKIWNEIVSQANQLMPQTLQVGSLEIINEAVAEQIGVVGGGNNSVVLLTLLGFVAGVGFAVIELLMHPTLNNVRDVETVFGLETIGIIPHDNEFYKRKGSIMTQQEDVGSSVVVQNFSAAAYILRNRLGTKEEHHCFYVTSATLGEGKSTVAANLAIQLSDMEHRTLLIDFDTRNPSLGALFLNKVDYAHSLNALYRGDANQDEAITTLSGYLDILPAVLEHNTINVDGILVELVEQLKEKYEYVILDAPPVGMVSGTLSLNQIANTVLFVVGYDISTMPEIQNALEKLDKSGIRVLGCVVNNVVSGRNLGMKQTADDYKKNINKKAKKPKTGDTARNFPGVEKEKAALEAEYAPHGAKLSSRSQEKKKSRLGKNTLKKPLPTTEDAQPEISTSGKRRNVYEDALDAPEPKPTALNEQETIDELVRIGLSNDWGSEDEPKPEGEPVSETEPKPEDESVQENDSKPVTETKLETEPKPEHKPRPEGEPRPMKRRRPVPGQPAPEGSAPRRRPPTGDAPEGSVPRRRPPTGDAPEGSAPRRRPPTGDAPDGSVPRRRPATGDASDGSVPRRRPATGDTPDGSVPRRRRPTGDAPEGSTPRRRPPTGDAPRRRPPTNDAPVEKAPTETTPENPAPTDDVRTEE